MNFDHDYEEFIEHLEKTCILHPVNLEKQEKLAVLLFVTYLNIRYEKAPLSPDWMRRK